MVHTNVLNMKDLTESPCTERLQNGQLVQVDEAVGKYSYQNDPLLQ